MVVTQLGCYCSWQNWQSCAIGIDISLDLCIYWFTCIEMFFHNLWSFLCGDKPMVKAWILLETKELNLKGCHGTKILCENPQALMEIVEKQSSGKDSSILNSQLWFMLSNSCGWETDLEELFTKTKNPSCLKGNMNGHSVRHSIIVVHLTFENTTQICWELLLPLLMQSCKCFACSDNPYLKKFLGKTLK